MQLSAHAQAGLERFQAALAANAHLSNEELLRRPYQPRLPLRHATKPRPRDKQPPPRMSRQYSRAISTLVVHDRRLVPNSARLALEIVALAGRRGYVETTKALLAYQLGLHERTIGRLLADLKRYDYLRAETTKTARGSNAGLRITVLPRLMPYYVIENAVAADEPGPRRDLKTKSLQEGLDLPQSATNHPQYRGTG